MRLMDLGLGNILEDASCSRYDAMARRYDSFSILLVFLDKELFARGRRKRKDQGPPFSVPFLEAVNEAASGAWSLCFFLKTTKKH